MTGRVRKSRFAPLLTLALVSGCAVGQPPATPARQTDCAALTGQRFAGGNVTAAGPVDAADPLPAYCRVRGVIDPRIRYEARLPLTNWNGRYYQSGCGGFCGSLLPDKPGFSNSINEALRLGYAVITTDNGHVGGLGDASWAEGDPAAVEVYAHRGIELTYRFGVGLVGAFYARPPAFEYFGGCSNGGRMGAMAAQRYPDLFDGILAGGSVLDLSRNGGIYGPWIVQANTGEDGARILSRDNFAHKLATLEAHVLARCDGLDGREDGLIAQPRACAPDLAALPPCGPDTSEDEVCFTAAERGVLERWYAGPHDSAGRPLYPGIPPGSERYWLVWFLDGGGRIAPGNALGSDYARYLGFAEATPADWSALDFDFDRDPARLQERAALLNATDPDLAAFRDAGGKLLMWHGWADPLVLPDQSIEYFESVSATLGDAPVREFFRLFMIPGHGHCWEMPSGVADRFNPIRILAAWVEEGVAPDAIEAQAARPGTARVPGARLCPHPGTAIAVTGADAGDTRCTASSVDDRVQQQ